MLMDRVRNVLFNAAIKAAIEDFFNFHHRLPIVLDIGTGSGLLATFAAKCGAQHVYACEALPAMARVAGQIVTLAGLDSLITVIPQRSTSLRVGDNLPVQCDLVISEILDSALLGEGVRPSLRDARRRLLAPGAPSVPASAAIYGQLVQSDTLRRLYHLPHAEGTALRFPGCLGGQQAIPLHFAALRDAWCLSEAILLFHVNFSAPHIGSSTEVASCEVVALGDGFVDGLLIFWELEVWPGLPHYSTDPYNRHWQDHWHQTLWPLSHYSARMKVRKGDVVRVLAFHNDYDVWADIQGSATALPTAPPLCTCGWHPLLPPLRILALNCDPRTRLLLQSTLEALNDSAVGPILDVCDGNVLGLLVAKHCPQRRVVAFAPKEEWRRRVLSLAAENGLRNVVVWAGPRADSWPEEYGLVSAVVGDGYFQDMDGGLSSHLNFWKLRTALAPILQPDVVVVPSMGRVMCAAAHFRHLSDAHGPVLSVEGVDHRPFAEAQAQAAAEDPDLAVGLWEYEHHLLTPPIPLMDLPFQQPLPDGPTPQCISRTAITHYGEAQALVLWVDLWLGPTVGEGGTLRGYSGPEGDDVCAKQLVRWLPQRPPVSPGHHDLVLAVSLDPRHGTLAIAPQLVPH
eukprot:EG_transcript_5763